MDDVYHVDVEDSYSLYGTSETNAVLSDYKWIFHPIFYSFLQYVWKHYETMFKIMHKN